MPLTSFLLSVIDWQYFISARTERRRSRACCPPCCVVVACFRSTDRSLHNVRIMVGLLGMPHLCHRYASSLAFLRCGLTENSILEGSVRDDFLSFNITPPVSEGERHFQSRNQSRFLRECRATLRAIPWSTDLSRPRTLLYREILEAVATILYVATLAFHHHGCALFGL